MNERPIARRALLAAWCALLADPSRAQGGARVWVRIRNDSREPFQQVWQGLPTHGTAVGLGPLGPGPDKPLACPAGSACCALPQDAHPAHSARDHPRERWCLPRWPGHTLCQPPLHLGLRTDRPRTGTDRDRRRYAAARCSITALFAPESIATCTLQTAARSTMDNCAEQTFAQGWDAVHIGPARLASTTHRQVSEPNAGARQTPPDAISPRTTNGPIQVPTLPRRSRWACTAPAFRCRCTTSPQSASSSSTHTRGASR